MRFPENNSPNNKTDNDKGFELNSDISNGSRRRKPAIYCDARRVLTPEVEREVKYIDLL